MKYLLLLLLVIKFDHSFAQALDTTDIFDIDTNHFLVLKPEIQKAIDRRIAPIVRKKVRIFKMRQADNMGYVSENQRQDELQFVEDTIYINEFLTNYTDFYSVSTTTMGMNWGEFKRLRSYDKLLNNYYRKTLAILTPEMRTQLIASQKRWLNYYTKEKEFIYNLNDFGNSNSSLYCWEYYFDMLEKRVLFLKDMYQKTFHGTNTYKE